MNISFLSSLCCPICKSDLALHVIAAEPLPPEHLETPTLPPPSGETGVKADLIREGLLLCTACRNWYPISSYVPVLLTFATAFHVAFRERHASAFAALSGYSSPTGHARPGERSVQSTFTDEWDGMEQDPLSFTYSREDLLALNERVWLKGVREAQGPIRRVLNVGCGLGRESVAVSEAVGGAEMVAVDLNFALLHSGALFKGNRSLHLVIASLFQLPFRAGSFDLVYSQGVIHHTYSTRDAFTAIAQFVRPNGYLFVWVYGLDDHLVRAGLTGFVSRAMYATEKLIRPVVSALPKRARDFVFLGLSIAAHPLIKTRVRHKEVWRLRNTDHDLRDWLSPRFAHRHSYNEVLEWFYDLGFKILDVQSPGEYRRLFHRRLWGVGVSGQRRGHG